MLGDLVGGEKLPFATDEDRAALVGRSILYACRDDFSDMGGKPHVFPRNGLVQAADRSAVLLDNGLRLEAKDLVIVAAA